MGFSVLAIGKNCISLTAKPSHNLSLCVSDWFRLPERADELPMAELAVPGGGGAAEDVL